MKKILILAYDFPPYVSVAGLRPSFWMQHFHEHDLYPIVVTRKWDEIHQNQEINYITPSNNTETDVEITELYTLIKTPYYPSLSNRLYLRFGKSKFKILRKGLTFINEINQYFFPVGTKKQLYKAAAAYLNINKVDYILATGDPFVLFHYANKLSKEHNIPWIADYRDPWSQDVSLANSKLLRFTYQFIEKKIVQNASSITTVDKYCKELLQHLFPNKNIEIIRNGFDSQLMSQDIKQQSNLLTLAFIGTIYDWHPIAGVFKSIQAVTEKTSKKIILKLYGINNESDIKELVSYKFSDLKDQIIFIPRMENKLLIQELKKDNLVLLFNSYSITGTKIFDYLGIKRKILFCFTEDEEAQKLKEKYYFKEDTLQKNIRPQIEILKDTQSALLIKNQADLTQQLSNLVQEFEEKGEISCNSINVENYSRDKQLEKLVEILHQM